jgi:hypothetical protein
MAIFKKADEPIGNIPYTAMARVYGPEIALAGYLEELTDAPDEPPSPIATRFLQKYLSELGSDDTPSFGG